MAAVPQGQGHRAHLAPGEYLFAQRPMGLCQPQPRPRQLSPGVRAGQQGPGAAQLGQGGPRRTARQQDRALGEQVEPTVVGRVFLLGQALRLARQLLRLVEVAADPPEVGQAIQELAD